MHSNPLAFAWAKRKGREHQYQFHLLRNHLLDTLAVADELWDQGVPSIQRTIQNGTGLDADDLRSLVVWLAGAHDIGKLTPAFQGYDRGRYQKLTDTGLPHKWQAASAQIPHGISSARILKAYLDCRNWSFTDSLLIACLIGGHHGRFISAEECLDGSGIQTGGPQWRETQFALLDEILRATAKDSVPPAKDMSVGAAVLVAGFVSIADWIASNDDFFPYSDELTAATEYLSKARELARNALRQLGWVPRPAAAPIETFSQLFEIERPSDLQQRVLQFARSATGPCLLLVEAPTGDGKTEAACAAGEQLRSSLGLDGLYFALPTQATSEQMFTRIEAMLQRQALDSTPRVLALLHGQASLSRDYERLKATGREYFRLVATGGVDEPGVIASEWFAQAKRGLLAPYGVGTIDQSLMAVLGSRHFFVRLFGLAGKVLIVDEVHAYDTYMSTLLDRLLEWAAQLQMPVIMLSATLPASRRQGLIAAYRSGLGDGTEGQDTAAYPRITSVSEKKSTSVHIEPRLPPRDVGLRQVDAGALTPTLRDALAAGGNIAVIANTVSSAQRLYALLRDEFPGEVELVHSRFLMKDRQAKIARVIARVGRDKPRPFRSIVISTQIIEQSLDLDFDLLVTELPPIDLLLQRIGRVHRHARTPHPMFPRPEAWVIRPDLDGELPRFGTSAYVYEPHILLRTWLAIRDRSRLRTPDETEALIEGIYGADAVKPDIGQELSAFWDATQRELNKNLLEERQAAQEAYIRPPSHDDALTLAVNVADANQAMARTRLLRPSATFIVLFPNANGGLSFDPDGDIAVQESEKPKIDQLRRLLENSVQLPLRRGDELPEESLPRAWNECSVLSGAHLLRLEGSRSGQVGNLHLHLDRELGVCRT